VSKPTDAESGDRYARMSVKMLWWLPAVLVVGFILASWLLPEQGDWPLWRVVPLAVVLMLPFAIGAFFGLRAVRRGCHRGWIGLSIHLVCAVVALVMPISEALTG
jgi:hypothetical protein